MDKQWTYRGRTYTLKEIIDTHEYLVQCDDKDYMMIFDEASDINYDFTSSDIIDIYPAK